MSTGDRGGSKWDRAARYLRIVAQLRAHPDGISAQAIADRIGVSKRTVYRDLGAMELDAELPIWQDKGRWGLDAGAFLPPLALTRDEAMTFFLAARLLARASDERDTELIGAYVKLAEILPPVLAEHLRATLDAYATTARNERFTRVFRVLTQAWAERRVVEIDYGPGVYDPGKQPRRTRVRPLAIEPSALTRALYLVGYDEERKARRTFKVERILGASLTPEVFDEASGATLARELLRAWDVITDQPIERVVVRFSPEVAQRVGETTWHPSQETTIGEDGWLTWTAQVAGIQEIRSWILGWGGEAEVIEPATLRERVRDELVRAVGRYR
jgi:predicted DNA-binding transcriptional regulator YafY